MGCRPYLSQADPGLRKVDEQAVLSPPPRRAYFLEGEIVSVLLQLDLHDERDGVHWKKHHGQHGGCGPGKNDVFLRTTALMLGKKRQRLFGVTGGLQHGASHNLDRRVVSFRLC